MTWSWRKLLQIRPLVRSFFLYKIGNGRSISVWFDNWCEMSPLCDVISAREIARAGFRLDSKLSDMVLDGVWKWPTAWMDNSSNIPVPSFVDSKSDFIVWKDQRGIEHEFSVGAAWDALRPRGVEIDWYNMVWFAHAIPRHAFLLWLIFKRKLKTQDMLRYWDISDQTLLLCPLCGSQPDSHDHLFFECVYSSQVWSKVKVIVDLHQVSSSWHSIICGIMPNAKKRSMQGIAAKLVLAASVYYIWQERNARLFQQKRRSYEQLVNVILATVRMKLMSFKFKETRRWEEFRALWSLPSSILMDRKT